MVSTASALGIRFELGAGLDTQAHPGRPFGSSGDGLSMNTVHWYDPGVGARSTPLGSGMDAAESLGLVFRRVLRLRSGGGGYVQLALCLRHLRHWGSPRSHLSF